MRSPGQYTALTRGIRIDVEPTFLPDRSTPDRHHFLWAYRVRIENQGGETIQLRSRHWRITDANGLNQDVQGPGVVGEEPVIPPGETFEYVSAAPLATPSGIMRGSYGMETAAGEAFEAQIPAFSLDSPHDHRRPN
ncbi:MAG: Co2+/Mg2+ efflux protein ApaG [Alphaproteobacteria bacterium]